MPGEPTLIQFGQQVRLLRREAKLSQEQLADHAEIHRTYLSGVERGERNISILNLTRLAKALNVTLSQLVEGL